MPGRRSAEIGVGGKNDTELQIVLTLRGKLADTLLNAADSRVRPAADVLADLIETILGDNLIDAVLDDAE